MAFIVSFARTAEEHTANITAGDMLGENSAQLTESNRGTVSNDAKKIINATEAIIAIGWSQGTNDIYWIQMLNNFSAQSKLAMTNIKVDPAALERVQKVDH